MAAHWVQDGFFALQASENGCPMEDLQKTSRYFPHWNALNQFSMHFNGFFISLDDDVFVIAIAIAKR